MTRHLTTIAAGRIPENISDCTQIWAKALRHRDGSVDEQAITDRMLRCFDHKVVRFSLASEPAVAFALTTAKDDASNTAILDRIAVLPEYAGRGIGRMLLEDAICAARAANYLALELEVRTKNRARHLYEDSGFVPISAPVPHALGGDPMVTYRLDLT